MVAGILAELTGIADRNLGIRRQGHIDPTAQDGGILGDGATGHLKGGTSGKGHSGGRIDIAKGMCQPSSTRSTTEA